MENSNQKTTSTLAIDPTVVKSTKYFIRESIDEIIYIKADSKGGTMIILGANGFIETKQDTEKCIDIPNTTSITEEEFETVYKETLLKLK